MTYRDRREARAARLREWAEKRAQKAESARTAADSIASMIPMGQPILVGHHSENKHRRDLDRINSGYDKAREHATMARAMSNRADGIERAAEVAIYSDDPDACERLREKLTRLEAERRRIKAYNASCRKGKPDTNLLDDEQMASLEMAQRHTPWACKNGAFPDYVLTNLGGTISRTRARLAEMER